MHVRDYCLGQSILLYVGRFLGCSARVFLDSGMSALSGLCMTEHCILQGITCIHYLGSKAFAHIVNIKSFGWVGDNFYYCFFS